MTFRHIQLAVTILAIAFIFSNSIHAQQDLSKKQLEHADYDVWSTMTRSEISRDGKWTLFTVQNGAIDGEATVTFRSLDSEKQYVIERGADPRFTWDSKFALYRITPSKAKLKQLKKSKEKNKTESISLPKPTFQILELETGELTTIENIKSFRTPKENGDWVACILEQTDVTDQLKTTKPTINETYKVTEEGLERPTKPIKLKKRTTNKKSTAPEISDKKLKKNKKEPNTEKKEPKPDKTEPNSKDEEKKEKDRGNPLTLINLKSGVQRTFPDVTSFVFSDHGEAIAFATSVEVGNDENDQAAKVKKPEEETKDKQKDKEEPESKTAEPTDGVYVFNLKSLKKTKVAQGLGNYKGLAFNEPGTQLAFLTDKDDYDAKTSSHSLYHWTTETKQAKKIASEGGDGVPNGWWVAPKSSQLFSEDGKRLYFETAPVPETVLKQRKDDQEEEEEDVAKLDVWHWQDPQLQPQQLLEADRERNRDYRAAYVLKTKKIFQLATLEIPDIAIDVRSKSELALANTNFPYRKMMSWEVPGFRDAWLVNLDTGKREQVLKRVESFANMSPEGKFITWFDGTKQSWFAKSTADADSKIITISKSIQVPLYNELHDRPSIASAYGSAGWLAEDKAILVYDRYDIWQLDPTGEKNPICVTDGYGRENDIQFRYRRLDPELRSIDPQQLIMLSAMNIQSKASGYWRLNLETEDEDTTSRLAKLIMLNENVGRLNKAQESDQIIFTRSTFQMCPDLWHSDMDFKKIHRLSDMNPQQANFAWGTSELVHWKSKDDQELDGLLYKPDGFDPSKKYPLMVYFYERNSDNLHRYYAPAAGRSTINFSFYVSRGYVVFIPDIPYTTGEPGQSAANAILPGVENLTSQGFIDEEKIGMQGHSWGGYQTAFLVTQTDMFACAESGAPVSNMTSAYGGIRWGSGMSRMFQYERTQSRIGDDLWSARDKYIQNSPVFYADKINTPLLILHNDKDGAVPWYQGIELFVALRRLEKPAWMLNYNGDPHWVMGEKNRRDFAIRMQQFFDHYLMDAPEPEWLAIGIPAVDKGKELGLELLEPLESKMESESETENQENE